MGLTEIQGCFKKNGKSRVEGDWKMLLYWLWRWRKGPQAKGCRWSLEAGKDKEIYSPPEPPKGMQPCQHLDFSQARPILDFNFQNHEIIYVSCLSH